MSGYQRIIICGNVGKDPEIRSFDNGGKIANFSIATSEKWKDKTTGEKKEKTEWHRISVKDLRLVDIVKRFVTKGSSVLIEGILETRKYQKDGRDVYTTEIVLKNFDAKLVLMGSKKTDRQPGEEDEAPAPKAAHVPSDMDDEIPF